MRQQGIPRIWSWPRRLPNVLLFAAVALPARAALAADYTVSAGGGGDYTSIQACADAAGPGDRCLVQPGTYEERVTVETSGQPDLEVAFEAQGDVVVRGFLLDGAEWIRVAGFQVTHLDDSWDYGIELRAAHHARIEDNDIHDTVLDCVRFAYQVASNGVVVRNNTLAHCGSHSWDDPLEAGGQGMSLDGDGMLIEGNDISHVNDFIILARGDNNVIRNNRWHDAHWSDWGIDSGGPHIDGVQAYCGQRNLVEGNALLDSTDGDTHFIILQDYGEPHCGSGFSGFIVRQNLLDRVGSTSARSSTAQPTATHRIAAPSRAGTAAPAWKWTVGTPASAPRDSSD